MTTDALQTLFKSTSTGATQTWHIEVEERSCDAVIITTYGQLGGKMQVTRDIITEGKNLGRVNATTPQQQAQAEALAQWEKKLKNRGYVQTLDAAIAGAVDTDFVAGGVDPMLAFTFEKQGHKIVYPAFVQPKLDGHRCIAIIKDGVATLWSRTRKQILSMPHIVKALEASGIADSTLDGELFVEGPAFEQLTSLIRPAYARPGSEAIQYCVYDVVADKPFDDRTLYLQALFSALSSPIIMVDTRKVNNEEEAMEAYAEFVSAGFEGAMLRNSAGHYESKRSYNLIKVKSMLDSEFRIVDVVEGRGRMSGRGIFECETASGATFRVKMAGPLDSLCEYLVNKDKYIGLDLTVQYQELTAEGLARFPVGLRLREEV